jgi:hypothetical protein
LPDGTGKPRPNPSARVRKTNVEIDFKGDTTTLDETLCEAGEQVECEATLRPEQKPKVNLQGIE